MYQLSRNLQHSDTSSDSADANDHLPSTSMLGLPWDLPSDVNQRRYSLRLDRDALVKQLLHLPNPDDLNVNHEALMKSDRLFDLAQGLSSGYYQEVLEFINHFFRATNAPGLVTAFRTIPGTNYDAIIDLFFIQGTDDELRYILQGIMVYRIIPHLLATLVWDLRYQVIPAFVQALLAIPQLTSRLAEDPYIGINYMETAVILAASLDVPGDIGQAEADEDIDFIREVHREGSIWQYPRIYQCLLPYSSKKLPATNLLIMLGENEASYYQWQSQSAFTYEHCEAWIDSNTDLIDFNYNTFSLYFG
ncbi:hypothetical protein H4R35_000920 [Dimargaris xerosporica]|nr:hypothetical protein H4R35_000920 [Dimargaris xerosporica]